jgi:hypothetical protein
MLPEMSQDLTHFGIAAWDAQLVSHTQRVVGFRGLAGRLNFFSARLLLNGYYGAEFVSVDWGPRQIMMWSSRCKSVEQTFEIHEVVSLINTHWR